MTDEPFVCRVVRADDLLTLTFSCFNLRLDNSTRPPQLVRATPGERAFIRVEFPPQHIAEQYFDIPGDSGRLPQIPQAPITTRIAGSTVLVFDVPTSVQAIPFTLEALLDWSSLVPSLVPTALPDPPRLSGPPPSVLPTYPGDDYTLIQVPRGLFLSPDATGRWRHSAAAVTRNGVTELWHTRLGTASAHGVPGSADSDGERRLPAVRAVYASALSTSRPHPDDRIPNLGLDRALQYSLVRWTTDFGSTGAPRTAPPLHATHVMLTPLGARADLHVSGDPDSLMLPNDWRQLVTSGHDQEAWTDVTGRLFPFGHRAQRTQITDREVQPPEDEHGMELLVRRSTLRLLEHERDFSRLAPPAASQLGACDSQMPLRRVTITDTVVSMDPGPESQAYVPKVGDRPYLFHCVAYDWLGRPVDFAMPMVFIPDGTPWSLQDPEPVALRGQCVALAQEPSSREAGAGASAESSLPVDQLSFSAKEVTNQPDLPFFPYVQRASVHLPALEHLLGSSIPTGAVPVTLSDPARTPGQVFARLADGALPLAVPPTLAGGLAAPVLAVRDVSRSDGVVPPVLDQIAAGRFNPRDLFGGNSAVLFGTVDLVDLIAATAADGQVPKLRTEHDGTALTTSLTWQPALNHDYSGPSPLRLMPGAALVINSTTRARLPSSPALGTASEPVTQVTGSLTRFALSFGGVVAVGFEELRFSSQTGRKMSVEPRGVDVTFEGELQFFNELANILPADVFGGEVQLRADPQGVVASCTLALPKAAVGVFSLENIALSTKVTLPFVTGTAASLRLAFSDPANPFLVTVAMIGGAGSCGIEVSTAGTRTLKVDASIELGGNISVDLMAVRANVHAMGGFYFAMQGEKLECSAYLRIGGSIELLGIAGLSVELYLTLTYNRASPPCFCGAQLATVAVHLLMFTTSVTLRAERCFPVPPRLRGDGRPSSNALDSGKPPEPCSFEELMDLPDWTTYCTAFA
ncbi:hypothetical protein [Streptomyces lydicus]|uniref:hypothetical protein n=1 Tax=Streptomyces lydicus TaxID=47763 RepID=UPI00131D6D6D|nr:hypothetical protein [Streptomyces lydicus]